MNDFTNDFMNDFIDTVRQMREKQREYFRTREDDTLRLAKVLERRADRMIRMMDECPGLFGDGTKNENR